MSGRRRSWSLYAQEISKSKKPATFLVLGLCILWAVLSLIVVRLAKRKGPHNLTIQEACRGKPLLKDLDIQEAVDPLEQELADAEEIDTWVRKSTEITRRRIAHSVLGLYILWVVLGLMVFLITGSAWLLVGIHVLGPLLWGKIVRYYFHVSKGLPIRPRK